MKLLLHGNCLIFAERRATRGPLALHLPFDGLLRVNGTPFASKAKTVTLPAHALREGSNVLLFTAGGRTYPVEELCLTGEVLSPTGFPCADAIADLLIRLTALEEAVASLVEAREKEAQACDLFP